MFYDLSASTWGPEEIEAIRRTVERGRFTMGEEVAAFEREFAAYFGMKHGVMVNSGSSANLVAVAAFYYKKDRPLARGDEVIVPAISWSTTYHPLQQYGLRLRFVDVELDTLNIDVRDRKSTRLNSSHLGISTRPLRDALPIYRAGHFLEHDLPSAAAVWLEAALRRRGTGHVEHRRERSEEHTSELQSLRHLHSSPTRRSSDLSCRPFPGARLTIRCSSMA